MLFINEADAAVLSCTPAPVASLPVTHLQNAQRSRVMRVMATSAVITGTFVGAKVMSGVVLYRHNLSAAAKWRVECFDGPNQSGALLFDSGLLQAIPTKRFGELDWGVDPWAVSVFEGWELAYSVLWLPRTIAQSFRITLTDAANAAGFLQAQRLYIGHALEPAVNFSFGHTTQWVDETTNIRTDGGSSWSERGPQYRRLTLNLDWLNAGDRTRFFEMTRRIGKFRDFFLSCYPEQGGALERDYSMACKFVDPSAIEAAFASTYRQPIEVEEI